MVVRGRFFCGKRVPPIAAYLASSYFSAFHFGRKRGRNVLRIERSAQEYYLLPGDRSALALEVTNPTLCPWSDPIIHRISVVLCSATIPKPVFALPPHGSHEVNSRSWPRERGVYRLDHWMSALETLRCAHSKVFGGERKYRCRFSRHSPAQRLIFTCKVFLREL